MKKITFLARFICKKIDYINRSKNLWIKDLDIRDTLCTPRYARYYELMRMHPDRCTLPDDPARRSPRTMYRRILEIRLT